MIHSLIQTTVHNVPLSRKLVSPSPYPLEGLACHYLLLGTFLGLMSLILFLPSLRFLEIIYFLIGSIYCRIVFLLLLLFIFFTTDGGAWATNYIIDWDLNPVYHLQGKALDKLDSTSSICYGDVEMIIDNVYEIVTTVSNKGSHNYYYCTVLDAC